MANRRKFMGLLNQFKVFSLVCLGILLASGALSQELHQMSGLASGQPGMNTYPQNPPGETTKLPRPYTGAPPLVPHSVVEFEIGKFANDCLDCHLDGVEIEEGHVATKVPSSHFVNEYTGERKDGQVIGTRYNCLQCHVPQSNPE
jgi:nitrate reductase cytochrome c-type subunit